MSDRDEFPRMVLSPEARAMYCRETGMTSQQADAEMTAENERLRSMYRAYKAAHPNATVEDFARLVLTRTLDEMAADMDPVT